MDSIACEDIHEAEVNQMLIAHLHSYDFFDVGHHPTASFVAERVSAIADCVDGSPNYLLRGHFTLRGVTRELEFPVLAASADGKKLTVQGLLDLDRTEFGSLYGSGRFFRFLGKHLVNDMVHLHLKIHLNLIS
jgi:polyisoprenoid-binding protein YceI